ncbi:hypothetical protein B0H16DRAFT_1480304 [Mycena metata]|uniref:FAD/NAD(P)-binding domain-containing protein n=1 Tax=Mycena metata TaxID=1033252 RepID=A0AAD7H487_9AGAR|nr:hypothetical protein B0H16DRAFT_1480304 [Mycena metata]
MSFASPAISLALTTCLLLLGVVWQKFCKSPPAWLKGLHTLGHSRNQLLPGTVIPRGTERDISRHSIAGIVTARICADHFERVIIIDPELEDAEKPRTRIMQHHAAHAHRRAVILTIFADGARRLWPEFDAEMKAVGGSRLESIFNMKHTIHYSGIPLLTPYKDYAAGEFPQTWVIRRKSSQKAIHRLFLRHPTTKKIKLVAGTIRGIRASEDRTHHIESVDVCHLDGTKTSFRDAALVVDCTGNRQSGLKWLKAAGFTISNDIHSSYDGNIRYATVCFTVSPELADKLPIPEAQRNTMLAYAYMPHEDVQSSCLALVLTDNNTSTGEKELPRTASEILPFIATFPVYHAPVASWVLEVIELLCEHGNPSFDSIRIADQSSFGTTLYLKAPYLQISLPWAMRRCNSILCMARVCKNNAKCNDDELSSPFRRCIA